MQPQYAPQQYPAQPPMPQFPQQPAYPVQQPYAQPQAPAYPVQPAYPPQGYPQQYPPQQPPAAPLPSGSLDGFFEQPSSAGGPSWKFNGKPIGTSYAGIVARTVTDADVRAQTNNAGQAQTYKDGRPKFVMVVPMQVQPSQEFPDGAAGWWVKGQARDELARAMAEAGAPAGPPEAGAAIRVTLVGQRAVPNMNPQLLYRVEYVRPQGAAQAPAPSYPGTVMQPPPAPQPEVQPAAPMPQPVMQTAPVVSTASGQPVVHQQPIPQAPPQQPAPVAHAPMAPQQQGPAPTGFSPEQAELFSRLTGSQG